MKNYIFYYFYILLFLYCFLRSISKVIMEKKNVLMNVARNGNRQSEHEIEKDIVFCAEIFAYYSRVVHKNKPIVQKMSSISKHGSIF